MEQIKLLPNIVKKLNLQQVRARFREKRVKLFGAKELLWFFYTSQRSVEHFLHRNNKKGYITRVRRNLYFFPDEQPHDFLVANLAYQPSYVSLETALSHYHLIPEIVYSVTSVTPKATQEFDAAHLHLKYQKIKTAAFTGYSLQQLHEDKVFLADPAKAVVDYLYFVSLGKKTLNERLDLTRAQVTLKELQYYAQFFVYQPLNNLISKL